MKNSELEWGSYNFFGAASTTTPARSFQKKANCVEMFIFITSCHELSNDQRCFFCITRSLLRLVAFTHNGGSSFQLSQAPHSDRTATAGWKPNKHTKQHCLILKKNAPQKESKNTSKHSPCVLNNPPQIPLAGFLTINYQNYIHTSHFGGWAFVWWPCAGERFMNLMFWMTCHIETFGSQHRLSFSRGKRTENEQEESTIHAVEDDVSFPFWEECFH